MMPHKQQLFLSPHHTASHTAALRASMGTKLESTTPHILYNKLWESRCAVPHCTLRQPWARSASLQESVSLGLPLWTPTPEGVNAMLLSTDEGHAHPMRANVGRAVVRNSGTKLFPMSRTATKSPDA